MVNYRASCRFKDALEILKECYEHIDDELKPEENIARKHLIELCKEIAFDYADDDDTDA